MIFGSKKAVTEIAGSSGQLKAREAKAREAKVADKPLTHQTLKMLGITVLLSQLPLLFHFPLWLSLPALALVIAKLKSLSKNNLEFPPLTTIVFVLVAIIAVFFHYGHIFGRDPCVAFLFLLVLSLIHI